MDGWKKFENDSTAYLQRNFGEYAQFNCQGGSDSTICDIEVITKTGKGFFIEAKHCPAQCGQFVLLPNISTGSFDYSRLNSTRINEYSAAIIEHMNSHFEEYKEAGTTGRDIDMANGPAIFASWIVQAYKDKGARLIITNNNIILPLEDFARYFYVSAKYRVKRSGSGDVGKGRMRKVSDYLMDNCQVTSLNAVGAKLFATSELYLHDQRFVVDGTEYMISRRDNRYEIRRLSNTFNANVIFSIELKPGVCGMSDGEFVSLLR